MSHELSTMKYFAGSQQPEEPTRHCSTQWTKGIWITCVVLCIVGCFKTVDGVKKAYAHSTGTIISIDKSKRVKRDRETMQLVKGMKAFNKKNQILLIAHRGFEVFAGLSLMFGGVAMMWMSPKARKVVMFACLMALMFHLSTAGLKVYQFISLKDTFESMSSMALRRAGVGGSQQKSILQHGLGTMGFGHSLGVLFVLVVESLFFARIMHFMSQPHVRETFAEDPYPEFREMEEEAYAVDAANYAATVREQLTPKEEKPRKETAAAKFAKV